MFAFLCIVFSSIKPDFVKKQDVMTLSDSDDVQTISSGSDDNKEKEKVTPGIKNMELKFLCHLIFRIYFFHLSVTSRLHTAFGFSLPHSGVTKKQVAVKSTRGIALKGHGMMVKTGGPGGAAGLGGQGGKAGQQGQSGGGGDSGPRNTRLFFDGEESCYIIDAKLEGNLGRYLNVSTRSAGNV